MKICLACSAGGHLTEIEQLRQVYEKHEHFFLTFRRADTQELAFKKKVRFVNDPKRNMLKLAYNSILSLATYIAERPSVVITTGAGCVIPFCYIAKLFGSKIIYIESYCRTEKPSKTGKSLYGISDLFIVQWEDLKKEYGKKAKYYGQLW